MKLSVLKSTLFDSPVKAAAAAARVHASLPRVSLPVHSPSICFDRALSKQLLSMIVIWTPVIVETHGV